MSDKMKELLPRSMFVSSGAMCPTAAVTERLFLAELEHAILRLTCSPVTNVHTREEETLFGRIACYNNIRPDGAKWAVRRVIDYDPLRCDSVGAASDVPNLEPLRTFTFLVHDEKVPSDTPPGAVVRFNMHAQSRPSHARGEPRQRRPASLPGATSGAEVSSAVGLLARPFCCDVGGTAAGHFPRSRRVAPRLGGGRLRGG